MSSGIADKIVNTLYTASLFYSILGVPNLAISMQNMFSQGFSWEVFIALSKCCLIQTCDLMTYEPRLVWLLHPAGHGGWGLIVKLVWGGRQSCAAQHRLGGAVCAPPALGVISACGLSPQLFSYPRISFTVCASVFPWDTNWGPAADIQILFYLQGFSITEVQKKQAMLNASKQHHTGKPKGESHLNIYMVGGWFHICYVGIVSMKWH